MKQIKNQFNEQIYEFKTTSGLKVQYLHRPGFKKSVGVLAVPFGGKDRYQLIDGEKIEHPLGVAHFLEHKVFEEDDKDVLTLFTELGANANAFTSYQETMFYFSHPHALKPSLALLLQFVRRFDIGQKSVEDEKPIIIEELKMYEQIPEMRLLHEVKNAVYHQHGYRYDIAGTVESVQGTSKEDLERAYRYNYADERMVLTIVGFEDPQDIQQFIEDILKHYPAQVKLEEKVENLSIVEPESVVVKEKAITSHFKKSKIAIAYKFPLVTDQPDLLEEIFDILLELNFSSLHDDYQIALDQEVITPAFTFTADIDAGVGVLYFFDENNNRNKLEAWIDNKMDNLHLDLEDFIAVKRKSYAQMVYGLSHFEQTAIEMARYKLENKDYFAFMEAVSQIQLENIQACLKYIEHAEKAVVYFEKSV